MRITKQMIRRIVREQAEEAAERPEDVEAVEDAWAGGDNLVHDVDYSKVSGGEPNMAEPEVLDIVVAEVRRRIQEMRAHPRSADLEQPRSKETSFPAVVGYSINGQPQSEIVYDDEELTQVLDYLAPLTGRGEQIPYSIDSLSDVEASDVPVGAEIEQYMEGKDQNKDGKNDFEDVKIAKMKASGMSVADIKKKYPELFKESRMRITRTQLRRIIKEAVEPMTQQYVMSMLKGRVGAGPDRGIPWADVLLRKIEALRFHEAASVVMDALMIDDPPEGADDELAVILSKVGNRLDHIALAAADWGTKHFRMQRW